MQDLYQKLEKDQHNITEVFRLLGPQDAGSGDSFDLEELCKQPPQAPQLKKFSSYSQLDTNNQYCLPNSVEENTIKCSFQQQKQLEEVPQIEAEIQQEQPKQQEPLESQQKIQPVIQTPHQLRQRIQKHDKKPVKLPKIDIESNQSPTTGSVQSDGPKVGVPCHCTKTQCLKLYCSCFHNNRLCKDNCICTDCHNSAEYVDQRKDAVDFIRSKGVRAHEIDKFDTSAVWGCKCRKTKCIKRYCECFIRGKKCTTHCKCEGCENRKVPKIKKRTKHTEKNIKNYPQVMY